MNSPFHSPILLLALWVWSSAAAHAATHEPYRVDTVPAEAYDRAVALTTVAVQGTVRNPSVTPRWLPAGDAFWYLRDAGDGTEYVMVDADTGSRRPAFDHAALAKALSALDGETREANALAIDAMHFDEALESVELKTGELAARCDLRAAACEALPAWRFDPFQLPSPDGTRSVYARDDNLWVRSLSDGEERQLTDDGERDFSYGTAPGVVPGKLDMIRSGIDGALFWVTWSPDSTRVTVPRIDERQVRHYLFTEALPADGANAPRSVAKRIALIGDRALTRFDWFVVDVASGDVRQLDLPPDCHGQYLGYGHDTFWSPDSRRGLIACFSERADRLSLLAFDAETGETRPVFEDTSDTFLDLNHAFYGSTGANIRFVGNDRAIVFSERDGWGHLYLIDLVGQDEPRQLTRGPWLVHDLLFADEDAGWFYYTAGGREDGRHPYFAHLYRTSLDGGRTELLTPEDAHHRVIPASFFLGGTNTNFSPDRRYFVDNHSRVDRPNHAVLRRNDGTLVAMLEEADASALYARGYVPPEPFSVKAADGETDVYGVLYQPKHREPGIKYPVVEQIYGVPRRLWRPSGSNRRRRSTASAGRGTWPA